MLRGLFHNISDAEKDGAVERIIQHATPRHDYFLMLVLSVSMAAFGVILNNTVILVGSMLVAPLLFPLFSFALGIIVVDEKLIRQSMYTIAKSIGFALAASFMIGLLFSVRDGSTALVLKSNIGTSPSLIYAVVAAISGFAGAFAISKPHLNESISGVAVSVSLVPPLATAGVALSVFSWVAFSNALLLFLVNVMGVIFSATIVFALLQFGKKKSVASETIATEEKTIKKEIGE